MMKPSILGLSVGLWLIMETLATLGIGVTFWARISEIQGREQSLRAKPALGAQIERLVAQANTQTRNVARHPATLACLTGSDAATCRAHAASLHTLYPDAQVYLTVAGTGEQLLAVFPRGAPDARTVSRPVGQFSLLVQAPVTTQGARLGVVQLDIALPELTWLIDVYPWDGGYVELTQYREGRGADGNEEVLARRGNQDLRTGPPDFQHALAGTPWRIRIWSGASAAMFKCVLVYGLLWFTLTVALALSVLLFARLLRGYLARDLGLMVGMLSDIRKQRLRDEYKPTMPEFEPTVNTMLNLGRLMVGKQKEVENQASLDHLSQVYNRRSFEGKQNELFKTLAQGASHSLLILDIDNFKFVNDTYGHDAGDQLIVEIGKALKACLRGSDFIARLGGDEFCVIFTNTPLPRGAELASRLREKMPREVEVAPGIMHRLHWSGGLSDYHKADKNVNMALSRADSALLEAKRGGRNVTRVKPAT
jgi:diguanylate cyclase (GGDEF)-like protein